MVSVVVSYVDLRRGTENEEEAWVGKGVFWPCCILLGF